MQAVQETSLVIRVRQRVASCDLLAHAWAGSWFVGARMPRRRRVVLPPVTCEPLQGPGHGL